jgi:hypothetical protein
MGEMDVPTCGMTTGRKPILRPQTFTSFGATAFEVQYWTGSAWAIVPGGSINK